MTRQKVCRCRRLLEGLALRPATTVLRIERSKVAIPRSDLYCLGDGARNCLIEQSATTTCDARGRGLPAH